MKLPLSIVLGLALVACGEKDTGEDTDTDEVVDPLTTDDDGDGYSENDGDCDDDNADLSPDADEICDGIDNDCDDLVDDDDDSVDGSTGVEYFADGDGDSYGDADSAAWACEAPSDSVDNGDDCNDADGDINPGATEVCDEGVDNDCDGDADDADDSLDATTGWEYFADTDGDGEGDANASAWACELADGWVDNSTDCDDTDADLNNADADNDTLVTCIVNGVRDCDDNNNSIGATDEDGDGSIACIDDCDDWNADWNALDTDGDGVSTCDGDCDDADAAVGIEDLDGDGYSGCTTDCWDSDVDEDGDGVIDSSVVHPGAASMEPELCTVDADGDGYGDLYASATFGFESCVSMDLYDSGSLWDAAAVTVTDSMGDSWEFTNVSGGTETYEVCGVGELTLSYTCTSTYDCDAHNIIVHTDEDDDGVYETEVYNDGTLATGNEPAQGDFLWISGTALDSGSDCDDADAASTGDDDADGYLSCVDDCDDTDAAINPGVDADADTFSVCDDCDDADAAINPDATETYYDGVDSNCDGWNDYDWDQDGDESWEHSGSCSDTALLTGSECEGAGTCSDTQYTTQEDCEDAEQTWTSAGNVWTSNGYDCDDEDDSILSLANEADPTACYEDDDGDGWGDNDVSDDLTAGTDCYDSAWGSTSEYIYPGAAYNESATDCMEDVDGDGWGDDSSSYADVDGTDCDDDDIDMNHDDLDGDGYSTCPDENELEDCDDADATTFPGAGFNEATYDATDYTTYECVTDGDGDGYAYGEMMACYTFDLEDSWGDGWNGGMNIEVFADGVSAGTATVDANSADGGYTESTTICVGDGAAVEFVFNEGSYASEAGGEIFGADDASLGTISGSGGSSFATQVFTFGGTDYSDGDTFYTETSVAQTTVGGTDADDTDASTH